MFISGLSQETGNVFITESTRELASRKERDFKETDLLKVRVWAEYDEYELKRCYPLADEFHVIPGTLAD